MDKASASLDPTRLSLRGGRLCLDFVNTVDPRTGVNDVDYLGTYEKLVAWAEHAGGIGRDEGRRLRGLAEADPDGARHVLAEAVELREALYRTFAAISAGAEPAEADLQRTSRWVARALGNARLVPDEAADGKPRYRLGWDTKGGALDRVLWPVARSGADLLAAPELARVRVCAGDDCGWAFLDVSKNRSRRWCTMDTCGNRAKARRHYARHHRAGAAKAG